MEELAHRFLVAAHQRRDLGDPFATSAGQHHLAATHLYAIRRAQTGSQGRALLVGERTDKDGRSHTSQDTPFRPTFTEIALGNHDYIALWEQTNYRSSGARDAATTAESTIRAFVSNNKACTYSDHSGNRGLIFATSPHARHALAVSGPAGAQLPTIGNIGLSAHSIGTAHDYVLTVFGLVTLWSIGMLLVWVIAGSALHGGLRAALALPVRCLAATVELAAYSLAGITWSVAWLLLPGLLFVLLLSWRFCAVLILALQKRSRPLDDGTPAGDHSRAGVESSVSR